MKNLNELVGLSENADLGRWVELDEGVAFRVRSSAGMEAQRYLVQRRRELLAKPSLALDQVGEEIRMLYKSLLTEWRGVSLKDKEVPYSMQAAEEIFSDKTYAALARFLIQAANEYEEYLCKAADEDVENLKQPSVENTGG